MPKGEFCRGEDEGSGRNGVYVVSRQAGKLQYISMQL